MIKEFVEYIVKKIVEFPEMVVVSVVTRNATSVLEIKVDEKDRGRVIGKEGQTIKALRTLVISAIPTGKKITIEVQ